MKTKHLMLAAIASSVLVSCSKPIDQSPNDDTPENFRRMFMVKRTDYFPSFSSSTYAVIGEDSINHSIYVIGDTTRTNSFVRYRYDMDGKLVSIVYHQLDQSNSIDSITITRPAANTIRWVFSAGIGIPGEPRSPETAVITDLGSNRRLVTIGIDGINANEYHEKLYLNTYGSADSSILKSKADAPGIYSLKRELFYNANHQPNTQVVTVGNSTSPVTTVTTSAITRDLHEHAYLHQFMDRLHGTDMIWLSFSPFRSISSLNMGNEFTDRILLLNGSILNISSEQKTYNNGILHSTQPTITYQYAITYDLTGRILVSEQKRDNVLSAKTEFTYYE